MADAIAAEPWTIQGNWQLVDELTCCPEQLAPFSPAPYLPEGEAPPSADAAEGGVLDWLGGALAGEWADDQTLGQIAVDFGLSVVPVLDQTLDARDLAAHVYRLGWKGEYTRPTRWVSLVFTLAGLIPGVGSMIKSASKAAFHGVQHLLGKVDELLDLGRRVSLALPDVSALARWVREHWAAVRAFGLRAWDRVLSRAGEIAAKVPSFLGDLRATVLEKFARLAAVSPEWLPRTFDEIGRMLRDALDRVERQLAPLEADGAVHTDALGKASEPDEVFAELGQELGSKPARTLKNWVIPGNWRKAKPEAFRLIFGSKTLPDINRPGAVKLTLGHIVEKATGGTHSLDNLMPQLNAVNVKLSGIFARKKFHLKLTSGEEVRLLELNGKKIEGSLREAFEKTDPQGLPVFSSEEQRAISDYMLFQAVGENPVFERELADLIKKIPNLADLVD